MVVSGAVVVAVCLALYLILFGVQSFDPKSLLLVAGFFLMAWKISSVKRRRNPMV
jgi:hypothetical protein